MHGADVFRVPGIDFDQFVQLGNMLIQRTAVGKIVVAQTTIEELVARHHFAALRVQKAQNFYIAQAGSMDCPLRRARNRQGLSHVCGY